MQLAMNALNSGNLNRASKELAIADSFAVKFRKEDDKSASTQVQTEVNTPEVLRRVMLQQLGIIKMVAETPTEQNREMLRKISSIESDTDGELVNWNSVFELINTLYSGFYDKLITAYGKVLTPKEEQIIVLMVAGFSTKEVSKLLSGDDILSDLYSIFTAN